jgi:hypothetical protein
MTQPSEVVQPAADAVETAAEAKPKTYASMEEMFDEVLDRSGLESFSDVVRTKRVAVVLPDNAVTTVDLGQPSPFDSKSVVVGIFRDDDEVRIYTFPKEKGEIKRYCVTKHPRVPLAVDVMGSVEQFIDEMAEEYAMLSDDDEPDEPPDPDATLVPS